jgi:dolichol kinase
MQFAFTLIDWIGIASTVIFIIGYFGFHLKYSPIKNHLDEIIVFIFFLFGAGSVHWYLYIMRLDEYYVADYLVLPLYLPIWGMMGLILIESGMMWLFRKMPILNARREIILKNLIEGQEKKGILQDLFRKGFHMLYFFLLLGVSLLAAELHTATINQTIWDFNWIYWNIRPGENLVFLTLIENPRSYISFGVLKLYLFFIFYIGTIIAIYLDWIRFSNRFWTLGRNLIVKAARKSEIQKMPSFIPILTGVLPAALILEPIPVFAIMITMIFADTAASQIGMRFGKHKIPWNRKKSWEGTIAGGVTGLLTWFFVGPFWAIGAMGGFVISDLLTEKPFKISDNLLTPLVVGAIFFFLTISGVDYQIPYWFLNIIQA